MTDLTSTPFISSLRSRHWFSDPDPTLSASSSEAVGDLRVWCGQRSAVSATEPFVAHRLVLSAASPFLHRILSDAGADDDAVLLLPDYRPSVVRSVLQLCYGGLAPLVDGDNPDVLELLQWLEIDIDAMTYQEVSSGRAQKLVPDVPAVRERRQQVAAAKPDAPLIDIDKSKHTCPVCRLVLATPKSLQLHLERHGRPKHRCQQCPEVFASRQNYWRHLQSTHRGVAFGCSECDKAFRKRHAAALHFAQKHPDKTLRASSIRMMEGVTLPSRKTKFGSSKRRPKQVACPVCQRLLANKRSLQNHLRRRHSLAQQQQHDVDQDDVASVDSGKGSSHAEEKIPAPKTYVCAECGMCFDKYYRYYDHRFKHLPDDHPKKPRCDACAIVFASSTSLRHHMNGPCHKKSTIKKYPCPECGKEFGYKANLKLHMHLHSGQYPHHCEVCNKPFIRRDQLVAHQRYRHKRAVAVEEDVGNVEKLMEFQMAKAPAETNYNDQTPIEEMFGDIVNHFKGSETNLLPTVDQSVCLEGAANLC